MESPFCLLHSNSLQCTEAPSSTILSILKLHVNFLHRIQSANNCIYLISGFPELTRCHQACAPILTVQHQCAVLRKPPHPYVQHIIRDVARLWIVKCQVILPLPYIDQESMPLSEDLTHFPRMYQLKIQVRSFSERKTDYKAHSVICFPFFTSYAVLFGGCQS